MNRKTIGGRETIAAEDYAANIIKDLKVKRNNVNISAKELKALLMGTFTAGYWQPGSRRWVK